MSARTIATAALLAAVAGCTTSESEPAGALAGSYLIAVENASNGCNLTNWTEGERTSGIGFELLQDGDSLHGVVGGATGVWLDTVIGGRDFYGYGSGDRLTMSLEGTRVNSVAGCTWTVDVDLAARVTGNTLTGTLTYRPITNAAPTCASIEGCSNRQDIDGLRL